MDSGAHEGQTAVVTSFTFSTARQIIFGAGRAEHLPGIVAALGRRPFVCTGSRPDRHAGLLSGLDEAAVFAIDREPTFELIRRGTDAARDHGTDVVVGLGGGSVMDAAKIIAALVANGGDPLDYAEVIGRGLPLAKQALPCVAVPTTAGTGSEVTANGVLTSTDRQVKVSLRSPSMLPVVALVDPALTLDCPPAVTAHAGLDALVQCIEPFVSPFSTPLTDGFCREGIRRAARGLRRAFTHGDDLDARIDMSLCSLLSGMALANSKLGAVHGLAGPLGGLLGAPHGALTAAVMVPTGRLNLACLRAADPVPGAMDRYAEVGELLTGVRDPEAGLDWFAETAEALGVVGLAAAGLTADQIPAVADAASHASSTKGNPVQLSSVQLADILHASL